MTNTMNITAAQNAWINAVIAFEDAQAATEGQPAGHISHAEFLKARALVQSTLATFRQARGLKVS